ncbi:unnamed protein product [Soboliphyme baturini]|uniref:FYR N-terminal domain-containing protein n=1 Tax=Soboliphyme baturini TaxID=241478 RepID=A0A183JAL5_9BILA|nr:unnamed protein product [Soboliphyme baturini]
MSSSALNGDSSNSTDMSISNFVSKSSRSTKRKGDSLSGLSKKGKGESSFSKLAVFGYPVEHPFNKDGYRYFLAEPDPHAPFKQEFDESHDTAGKPIPSFMYRVVRPLIVQFSFHDRAPQIKLSDDRLTATGEKGYSIVRASHGVSRGTWFCEMKVVDQSEGSHSRIGWSQSLGERFVTA